MTDPLRVIRERLGTPVTDTKGRSVPAIEYAPARLAITRRDPLAFAWLYLRHHLKDTSGNVTLSDVHLAWAASAVEWVNRTTEPYADRRAEIAPREMGKSTWWFLILPMWAAAHGHVTFAAAFANTSGQAETHLATFKTELDDNALLRHDFPDLCTPKTRGRGTVAADRVSLYRAQSGFTFAAAGMDSSNLGMKIGASRPDLIILDDIEPHEGRYSKDIAAKRLDTLRSAILPLNIYARVRIVGTVTMQDSIVHQIAQAADGVREPAVSLDWVAEERIEATRYAPIITLDDGERASVWPEKWSIDWLLSIEHTRQFAKNYANDPMGAEGDYWQPDDIRRADLAGITHVVLSIDPAVTTKKSSDYTGLAVVGYSRPAKRAQVLAASQVKLDGAALRLKVLDLIEAHRVGLVIIETNQGGDLWKSILWGLPVRVKAITQSESKEVRAAEAHYHYQRGRVTHAPGLSALEGQLVAFPKASNDDMVDAVSAAVRYFFTKRRTPTKPGGTVEGYVA